MPITINWQGQDQTILHCEVVGTISSAEMRTAFVQIQHLSLTTSAQVDVLLELANDCRMPGTFLSILATFLNTTPQNFGMMVIISDTTYTGSLVMAFWQVYPFESKRIHLAKSTEQALTIIEARCDVNQE